MNQPTETPAPAQSSVPHFLQDPATVNWLALQLQLTLTAIIPSILQAINQCACNSRPRAVCRYQAACRYHPFCRYYHFPEQSQWPRPAQQFYGPPPAGVPLGTDDSRLHPHSTPGPACPICPETTHAATDAFVHQPYASAGNTPSDQQDSENLDRSDATEATQPTAAAFGSNEAGFAPLVDTKLRTNVRRCMTQTNIEQVPKQSAVPESAGQNIPKTRQVVPKIPGSPKSPALRSPITVSPTPWNVLSDHAQYSSDDDDASSLEKAIWTTVRKLQKTKPPPRVKRDSCELLKCSECTSLWRLPSSTKEWYENRHLCVPKRCAACRKRKQPKTRERQPAQLTQINEYLHETPRTWKRLPRHLHENFNHVPQKAPQSADGVSRSTQAESSRSTMNTEPEIAADGDHELPTLSTVRIWTLKAPSLSVRNEVDSPNDGGERIHGRGILFPLQTIAPHPPKALPSTALPTAKHEQQSDSDNWWYEDDGNTATWQGEPHQSERELVQDLFGSSVSPTVTSKALHNSENLTRAIDEGHGYTHSSSCPPSLESSSTTASTPPRHDKSPVNFLSDEQWRICSLIYDEFKSQWESFLQQGNYKPKKHRNFRLDNSTHPANYVSVVSLKFCKLNSITWQ